MDLGCATRRIPSFDRPPVRSRAELSRTMAYLPGCLGCPRRAERSRDPGRATWNAATVPRRKCSEPLNSQSSATALQRAAEPTFQNRMRSLRGPISRCRGGRACLVPPLSRASLQIECGDSLNPINRRVSVRRVSSSAPHPPQALALPTPGGAPLIDVSPGGWLGFACTHARTHAGGAGSHSCHRVRRILLALLGTRDK